MVDDKYIQNQTNNSNMAKYQEWLIFKDIHSNNKF